MNRRRALAMLSLLTLPTRALADPPTLQVAYRRVCRSYVPASLSVARDGTFSWCLARFRAADGAYVGPVTLDLAVQQPATPAHLANGHAVVTRTTAAGVELRLRSHDDDLRDRLLAPSLTHLRAALISSVGDSALVTRADGRREVVSLPSGTTLLALPAVGAETAVTVSPSGDRVALGDGRTLSVYARAPAGTRRIALISQRHTHLAYARDGRTLLVERGDDTLLTAYRETAPAASAPATLRFAAPPSLLEAGAPPPWLPTARGAPSTRVTPGAEHGLLHTWSGDGVRAALYASDARELREFAGRSTGWTRAVMDRFAPGGYDPSSLRFHREPNGERTATFRRRLRALTTYEEWMTTRVTERSGVLYRVELIGPEAVGGRPCGPCTEAVGRARRALLEDPFAGSTTTTDR